MPTAEQNQSASPGAQQGPACLTASLDANEAILRQLLGDSQDLHFQRFNLLWEDRRALIIFLSGLCDTDTLQKYVLEPLKSLTLPGSPPTSLSAISDRLIRLALQSETTDLGDLQHAVYRGQTLLLVEGFTSALILDTQGWEERPVQSPPTETVLRGPRDGFVENINTNIALVRRRISDPTLRFKFFTVGVRSHTRLALAYMSDITPHQLVHEMETRLAAIQFDGILDANQVRELVVGTGFSPFPKMESTERPDKVAAALTSGKVAIFVDTSPFVAVAPTTLMDTLWAADDYYTHPTVVMMIRLIRIIGWAAVLFISPLYIAIEMYTPDFVRTDLALYLARERVGVPLTAAMEIIFLEIMMEMIFESTVRLPSKIGSAGTVVGGLIVGQAAVQARLISGVVIIVAAISAIGSFTLPSQEIGQIWRVVKWLMILSASIFGLYGLFAVSLCLLSYIASIDSFGTPYLAPFAPFIPGDLARDFVLREPWSKVRLRGQTYKPRDPDRNSAPQVQKYQDGGER